MSYSPEIVTLHHSDPRIIAETGLVLPAAGLGVDLDGLMAAMAHAEVRPRQLGSASIHFYDADAINTASFGFTSTAIGYTASERFEDRWLHGTSNAIHPQQYADETVVTIGIGRTVAIPDIAPGLLGYMDNQSTRVQLKELSRSGLFGMVLGHESRHVYQDGRTGGELVSEDMLERDANTYTALCLNMGPRNPWLGVVTLAVVPSWHS